MSSKNVLEFWVTKDSSVAVQPFPDAEGWARRPHKSYTDDDKDHIWIGPYYEGQPVIDNLVELFRLDEDLAPGECIKVTVVVSDIEKES